MKTNVFAIIFDDQNTKNKVLANLIFLIILIFICEKLLSFAKKIVLFRFNEIEIKSWMNLTL